MCSRAEAAGGDRGRPEPDAGRVERLARVERDRVVVEDEPGPLQRLGRRAPADAPAGQVDQQQVVVGAARDEVEAALEQRVGERLGVVDDRAARRWRSPAAPLRAARPRSRRWCGRAGRPASRGRPPGRSPARARPGSAASPRAGRAGSCAWSSRSRRRGRPARDARRRRSARRCGRRRPPAPRRPRSRPRRSRRSRSSAGSPCRRTRSASAARAAPARGPRRGRPRPCRAARRSARRGTTSR